ncbi:MAG: hypothetical protein HC915_10015 [Anaerolineae bacterium]|nr:hypothetical protein [Anaerolineae bacterium]
MTSREQPYALLRSGRQAQKGGRIQVLSLTGLDQQAGQALLQPDLPLIVKAEFSSDTITPNADGSDDITAYRYELSENANVTLAFTNENGDRFASGRMNCAPWVNTAASLAAW